MSGYGEKVQVFSKDWNHLHARIERLELLLEQANRHKEGRGIALQKSRDEVNRISALLLEGINILERSHKLRDICPDSEHEWINKVLNRDSAPSDGVANER